MDLIIEIQNDRQNQGMDMVSRQIERSSAIVPPLYLLKTTELSKRQQEVLELGKHLVSELFRGQQ